MEVVLELSLPPSLNGAYSSVGRRRVKSKAYRVWLNVADLELMVQRRHCKDSIKGPYSLHISVPQSMRGDVDNRVKPLADFLVSQEITTDDRFCQAITVRRDPSVPKGMCRVTIGTA